MTYPAGVQLNTLTFNSPATYLGNPVTRTEITVQVSAGVVWAATGETIKDITSAVALGPGMPGAVTFPAVDQSGYTNQSGTTITMWSYSVTRKMFFGSSSVVVQKNWQPLTGQATTDFDALPAGTPATPAPVFPVTSVAGKSGTVAASDLATAIAPLLPLPDLPGKLNTTAVGAALGVAPLDSGSKVPDANLPAASNAAAVAAKVDKSALAATSDATAYLNNVALLCQFPVRENGEVSWPQGFSINKAADEIYVSNQNGTELRIDVRTLSTGVRKSSKIITTQASTWSQGLPWFYNGSSQLCFIVRITTSAQANPSTYAIYNYTTGVLGANININGSTNADVCGNFFVTSDAWVKNANFFYIYDWASIQAGTPNLLVTIPLENAGTPTLGKVQGIAIVGSHLYFIHGEQGANPAITVFSMSGRLVTTRNYSLADFQTTVNTLLPGSLTNNGYLYENESGTNLDGKLVTMQIVNNNPAVTAQGVCLVLQHNRVDGVPIKGTPAPTYVYDTGWQPLTLEGTWTVANSTPPMYRRIGNEVRFKGAVTNTTASTTLSPFTTLPVGFRPLEQCGYAISSNANTVMNLQILTSGSMQLYSAAVTTAWRQLNGVRFLLD